jgi:glucosamine-6-phosphate deaminase
MIRDFFPKSAPAQGKVMTIEQLAVRIHPDRESLAEEAAKAVNAYLSDVIKRQGNAAVILATGNSQIAFLKKLIELGGIDWSKVILFHMDEYLGIADTHKASFRRYMRERVESLVRPKAFHYLEGDVLLPLEECDRYEALLRAQPIDLCCLGIGENGHLAFNDPPVARFEEKRWVKLVKLDLECKTQQVNEGHFANLDAVPPYAFSLTIPALCAAKAMVCISPEKRKAQAVKGALKGPISTDCPASILRKQAHAILLLDSDSAELL